MALNLPGSAVVGLVVLSPNYKHYTCYDCGI